MRIFLMIDLHLSAFAPRWRFLYVVRIDAYIVRCPDFDALSLKYFISVVKDGVQQ